MGHGDPSGRGGRRCLWAFCGRLMRKLVRLMCDSLPKMQCKKHEVLCGLICLVGFAAVRFMQYHVCYVSSFFICVASDCLFRYNVVHTYIDTRMHRCVRIYIYIYIYICIDIHRHDIYIYIYIL